MLQQLLLLLLLVMATSVTEAFAPVVTPRVVGSTKNTGALRPRSSTTTALPAAPILIISGFLKKRQEEERKKERATQKFIAGLKQPRNRVLDNTTLAFLRELWK